MAKKTAKKTTKATKGRKAKVAEVAASNGAALVIVESPTKAKSIGRYLGRGYDVRATVGHLRDLPTRVLGVDVDAGFEPTYVTIKGKTKTLGEIKKAARGASAVFLATDPDREGEAIAWHVADQLESAAPTHRVLFHEITADAVREAMAHPGAIDGRMVDAQQARRILDRLVGYKASPILWKTIKTGLSAGRVQTVALRLIVEREDDIRKFVAQEYCAGGDLRNLIAQGMAADDAVKVLLRVAGALKAAHARGFVHGDLRPANVMIREDGSFAVVDFALAKVVEYAVAEGESGVMLRSPDYLSPEMINGEPADVRSDVYALGLLLHEMLTGRRAYASPDLSKVMMDQLNAPVPVLPSPHERFQPLLDKLMAKRLDERFASVADVIAFMAEAKLGEKPAG